MRRVKIGSALALASAFMVSGSLASGVAAQDGSTEGETMGETPVECTAEPRVLDELLELFGEVQPAGAGEAASLERNDAAMGQAAELPLGRPADQQTRTAAQDAVRGLFGCFNAGDLLGGWGAVSDDFLLSVMDSAIFDEDFVAQIEAGPAALPQDQQTVVMDFGDTLVLESGEVGVIVHYNGPASPGEGIDGSETDMFILKEVDGNWLLNSVVENIESSHGLLP